MNKRKLVIIIGVPRSGTTLLASMLGGHPEISMMDECYSNMYKKQIGTKVIGNKIACDGMVFSEKRSRIPFISAIINRIINLPFGRQLIRMPIYDFSAQDLIDEDAKFVIIQRKYKDVIDSNVKRGKMNRSIARLKYRKGKKVINNIIARCNRRDEKAEWIPVSYEDIVDSSSAHENLVDICNFLGISASSQDIERMITAAGNNARYGASLNK